MFDWNQDDFEEIKRFIDELDVRSMCSWLLRFSPQDLPIISTIIGILLMNDLTGRETLILGNFLVHTGAVLNLQGQQKLLIQESKRAKFNEINENLEANNREIAELRQQINDLKMIIKRLQ